MSAETIIANLRALALGGMAECFEHQINTPAFASVSFDERLDHLINAEISRRTNRRVSTITRSAKFKVSADPADIDFCSSRGIDREHIHNILQLNWVLANQNVIITGATGTGKTWLSCALGTQCARNTITVRYFRAAQLFHELRVQRESGGLMKVRSSLQRTKVLIIDDFGLNPMSAQSRQDLLDVLDDRLDTGSLIIAGQLPPSEWHAYIGDPAIADAILDRLAHSSLQLELAGESMRRLKAGG
jgi:DNA replication protein DnaC